MKLGRLAGFLMAFFLGGLVFSRSFVLAQSCECSRQVITVGIASLARFRIEQDACGSDMEPQCKYDVLMVKTSCDCVPDGESTTNPDTNPYVVDATAFDLNKKVFCKNYGPETTNPKVSTALGCVPVKIDDFAVWLLPWVFGIAGGIAFLLMVVGFIQIAAAKGDPKAMQAAKEMIGSALTGLLVCIFAIFILRLIAVNILRIPGMN